MVKWSGGLSGLVRFNRVRGGCRAPLGVFLLFSPLHFSELSKESRKLGVHLRLDSLRLSPSGVFHFLEGLLHRNFMFRLPVPSLFKALDSCVLGCFHLGFDAGKSLFTLGSLFFNDSHQLVFNSLAVLLYGRLYGSLWGRSGSLRNCSSPHRCWSSHNSSGDVLGGLF